VSKLAVQLVGTLVPCSILGYVRAFFWQIIEILWGSPEVLLPMRVVAIGPLMLMVDVRAECAFVEEHHEGLQRVITIVALQLMRETLLLHKLTDQVALLRVYAFSIKYTSLLKGSGYIFCSSSFICCTCSISMLASKSYSWKGEDWSQYATTSGP
jgi:hypothetical protein